MADLVIVQQLATLVYLTTMTVVGVRLMLLFRRTRRLPELLLGGGLSQVHGRISGPRLGAFVRSLSRRLCERIRL